MIDHFRTLLLNTTPTALPVGYTAESVSIDKTYGGVTLPSDLTEVYDFLFPTTLTFKSKLHLAHVYMNLVNATGLAAVFDAYDVRKTYKLKDGNKYFQPGSVSVGVPSVPVVGDWLRTFNFNYPALDLDATTSVDFTLAQTNSTNYITLTDSEGNSWDVGPNQLSFTDGLSQTVSVFNNRAVCIFQFVIKYAGDFTATASKTWKILLTAPNEIIIKNRWDAVSNNFNKVAQALDRTKGSPDPSSYDRLFLKHFNINYRLAGLLVGLIYRMNKIRA